jgi:hypothetical protein
MAWAAAMSVTMLLSCCNTATLRPSAPATRGLSLLSCSSTGRGSDGRPVVGRSTQHPRARPGSPTTVVWSLNTRARAPRFSNASAPPVTGYLPRQLGRRCQRLIAFCCWLYIAKKQKAILFKFLKNYMKSAKIKCFSQFDDGQNLTEILRKITRNFYIVQVVAKNVKGYFKKFTFIFSL